VGWDLLVGISIATAAPRTAVRLTAGLLPVLMAYAVIATGNHYVVDVLVGVRFGLLGHLAALRLERLRDRRADRRVDQRAYRRVDQRADQRAASP
jgi:membrane-associated phospholipid phosphatase